MSKIALTPNASGTGTFTIASPNSNTDRTLTLPDAAGTVFLENGSGTIAPTNISDGTLSIPTTYVTNGSAKAWVNFDGTAGTLAPRDSLNVSSLTDNGTGDYTVNFTANFSNINYSTVVSYSQDYGVARCVGAQLYLNGSTGSEVAPTAAQARLVTTSASANYDAKYVCVSNHGNLA